MRVFGRKKSVWKLVEKKDWEGLATRLKSGKAEKLAKKVTAEGQSLLSCAMAEDPPFDILKALVTLNPAALHSRDESGRLPLHLMCQEGSTVEIVKCFIDHHPQGVSTMDNEGRLPIHYAVKRACADDSSLDVVATLLGAYPESVYMSEGGEKETPMDIAIKSPSRRASSVVRTLRQSTVTAAPRSHRVRPTRYSSNEGPLDRKPTSRRRSI